MIVGEPSLMGGEMDDEDERYISRLENTLYDPNNTSSLLSSKAPKREPTSFSNSPLPSMFANHSQASNGTIRGGAGGNSPHNSLCNGLATGEKSPPLTPQPTVPN